MSVGRRDSLLMAAARLSRALPRFRGKTRLQRLLSSALTQGGPSALTASVGGVHWELDPSELIQFRILWDGGHDPHVVGWLCRRLAGVASTGTAPVLWDVGANVGAVTLSVAAQIPGVRVEAFEPSPRVRERLQRNVALNPGLDVCVHALALANEPGRTRFFESAEAGNSGIGTLYQAHNTRDLGADVVVERGDALIAEGAARAPDVVKIDVEGFEPEVLEGLSTTLAGHRPALVVESSAYRLDARGLPRAAIARRLTELGFEVRLIDPQRTDGYSRLLDPRDLAGNVDLAAIPVGRARRGTLP